MVYFLLTGDIARQPLVRGSYRAVILDNQPALESAGPGEGPEASRSRRRCASCGRVHTRARKGGRRPREPWQICHNYRPPPREIKT